MQGFQPSTTSHSFFTITCLRGLRSLVGNDVGFDSMDADLALVEGRVYL